MINNTTKDLLQRKQVGKIIIDSKKDNYIITAVYISPYTINIKKDENIKKFEEEMLKYFSYEIAFNSIIKFFFDFDKCIKELGIDVNDNLPIPYLIKINIIDKEIKTGNNSFLFSVITERIEKYYNEDFNIYFKKLDIPGNEEFSLIRAEIIFIEYFIVHKSEEEWKKLKIYKDKASMHGYDFL